MVGTMTLACRTCLSEVHPDGGGVQQDQQAILAPVLFLSALRPDFVGVVAVEGMKGWYPSQVPVDAAYRPHPPASPIYHPLVAPLPLFKSNRESR